MGLFGLGASASLIGSGPDATAAHSFIRELGASLEANLQDTPSEYFVLQAAGMLFASESRAFAGIAPVASMQESLSRADKIMTAFVDSPSSTRDRLEAKANATVAQLRNAVGRGVPAKYIVGNLNDYLHFLDNDYLQRAT